jgi:uncharacterized alkaline shock family protein YloU
VNTFNRLVMIILLLGTVLAIAIGILLLLLAPQSLAPIFSNIGTRLASGRGERNLSDLQIELTVLGLIVFVPAIILLWLEVRRTARDTIRISKVSGSEAHLSTQAVAQSLIYYVDALEGVVRVRPRLAADAKAISVRLDVETTPDVDVRAKTEEISQTARNVIEDRLGLKLKRLNIHIHHSSFGRNMQPSLSPNVKPSAMSTPQLPSLVEPPKMKPPSAPGETKNPLSA